MKMDRKDGSASKRKNRKGKEVKEKGRKRKERMGGWR